MTGSSTEVRLDPLAPREIRTLSSSVVNKIAAGEVIERPASVVKELMENAVDAGARRIDVAIEKGGTDLIRVTDDGCGMRADQLRLAVTSHATSKIVSADDLFHVASLGFRGEALASIAEISHFSVRSRVRDDHSAYEMDVAGGEASEVRPTSGPVGTAMEVRNLFFNTPVRRRYLKTTQTETGHITEAFTRIALPHPEIHFRLTHNGRTLHDLPPNDNWKERIGSLFGSEIRDALIRVASIQGDVELNGYVVDPAISRTHNRMQYLFLNGRFIRDRSLQHALGEAYRGLLMTGRFPVAFVRMSLPPDQVDVNVHPCKLEVRLEDAGRIYSQLLATIRERFLTTDLTAKVPGDRAPDSPDGTGPASKQDGGNPVGQPHWKGLEQTPEATTSARLFHGAADQSTREALDRQRRRDELSDWANRQVADSNPAKMKEGVDPARPIADAMDRTQSRDDALNRPPWNPPGKAGQQTMPLSSPRDSLAAWNIAPRHSNSDAGPSNLDPGRSDSHPEDLGRLASPNAERSSGVSKPAESERKRTRATAVQIQNRYLVTEAEAGMIVIDQHALHERILYESFREKMMAGSVETQKLLVPEPVSLSPAEAAAVVDNQETLKQIGLEVEPFGGGTILITAYPAMLTKQSPSEILRTIVEGLLVEGKTPERRDLIDEMLQMMSCKAAVKAGDRLSNEEIETLLEHRDLCQDAHHCPHGRPTALVFSREELDRRFKRI